MVPAVLVEGCPGSPPAPSPGEGRVSLSSPLLRSETGPFFSCPVKRGDPKVDDEDFYIRRLWEG